MDTFISEIQDYLIHKDYDLALRRMLDLSYFSQNEKMMRLTMACSAKFASETAANKESNAKDVIGEEMAEILRKLSEYKIEKPAPQTLLQTTDIVKVYGSGNFTLQSKAITINSGQIVGVVGENGNGKTTLLRSLAGQLKINSGDISYPLLNSSDYYDIKNYVVFIAQRIPRWYGKLKDNLHFSATLAGVLGKENDLLVDFMIERLGLRKYEHYTWETISSGYRTRFEIARVLLQKPQLLILDEPLANLDINAQQTLLTDLRYIVKTWKDPLAIMLSSQQLHEVEKVADDVIYIKNGHCTFNPVSKENLSGYVIEIESNATRAAIAAALPTCNIQYNGGLYAIHSEQMNAFEMLLELTSNKIPMNYYRDISTSSKRLF